MINITTDIFCDRCPMWVDGETTGRQPRVRLARRNAKRQGWTCRVLGGRLVDLCPECTAELAEGQSVKSRRNPPVG